MSSLRLTDLEVSSWLNTEGGFALPSGKVVALHAFQMLCPGCVLHGIPQAQKLHSTFSEEHVSVLGLHTVFEHHEAMQEPSLRAFLHEFRVAFPIGIDIPSGKTIPKTMRKFQMQGTPTWLIFDRQGELKIHSFGQADDLALSSEITRLALEGLPSGTSILRKSNGEPHP